MRYFLAIPLSEEIKQNLHNINSNLSNFKGIKFVSPDNMHLTLLFLGDNNIEKKISELKKINFKKFNLKLEKIVLFPDQGKFRLIWAELKESKDLLNLQKKLSKIIGINKDYRPHITLARIKKLDKNDKKQLVEEVNKIDLPKLTIKVKNFKLYSSELTVLGPVHRVIEYFDCDK